MRIATWNLQRKRPTSSSGKIAVDHLRSVSPDIAILTEAWVDHLGSDFRHTDASPSGIPHLREEERKVVIASRWPITNVRIELDVPTAGRFVSAVFDTPEGSLTVIGICIPWFASRVRGCEELGGSSHLPAVTIACATRSRSRPLSCRRGFQSADPPKSPTSGSGGNARRSIRRVCDCHGR